MSNQSPTIPKTPLLKPTEDFYRLRREGIGFIANMGSRFWTDYNTHDPGITILEALCYAITDLTYRTGWDIKDILMPATKSSDLTQPYPNQTFFSARDILTVNPTTPDDFRRLLIDLEGVRNAWVYCKQCACDFPVYAVLDDKDQAVVTYVKPSNISATQITKIQPQGLYDVLLELETNQELGDLNDQKVIQTLITGNIAHPLTLELRFSEWKLFDPEGYEDFIDLLKFKTIKSVISQPLTQNNQVVDEDGLQKGWHGIFSTTLKIELEGREALLTLQDVTLRIYGSNETVKTALKLDILKKSLEETQDSGFVQKYRKKLSEAKKQIELAQKILHSHRNLDEDYCNVSVVGIEDVAVCADVEVTPDADIERIQAQIWFEIEQHFNPPVPFYTLQELQNAGIPVETIFNGPELTNGFIKTEELQAAQLKTVLRTSDIINRLMDIEGIVAFNYLALTKYDATGNAVHGSADPEGEPAQFNPNKISASWQLHITEKHQPRFHRFLSRFLFFKNGLPFTPRMDEALDTLTQLRGEAERLKIKNTPQDIAVPSGSIRETEKYYPLQYSFPLTYGVGPEGLPSHASPTRQAQAKQLKAYLMVFEQLLGNALAQLAHIADLFSLDANITRTYFFKELSEAIIVGYKDLVAGLDAETLATISESTTEFHRRRNRFLDHLMARFGEQFGEYALLLSNFEGQQVALDRLIRDKLTFLKTYPAISHDRGKAFNYKNEPCFPHNLPGLKKRVNLLLGYPELDFYWDASSSNRQNSHNPLQLKDRNGGIQFELPLTEVDPLIVALKKFVDDLVKEYQPSFHKIAYENGQLKVELKDKCCNVVTPKSSANKEKVLKDILLKTLQDITVRISQGTRPEATKAQLTNEELEAWGASQRAILVEHLLLRPKFPGDALYPTCIDGGIALCGDEDPYSFRLTFVMPGWTKPYNTNMDMRRFADRTIREQTPSHLLCKVCWIGNSNFDDEPSGTVINDLYELLEPIAPNKEAETLIKILDSAMTIFNQFRVAFKNWYKNNIFSLVKVKDLNKELKKVTPSATEIFSVDELTPLWPKVRKILAAYFYQITIDGWQFERFEKAWCEWLEENATIDWTEQKLPERVEALLISMLIESNSTTQKKNEICQCATAIVEKYGMAFYNWVDIAFKAGKKLVREDFKDFDFKKDQVALCDGLKFKPETAATMLKLLEKHYENYVEVSYRLKVVLSLLSNLHNTYPAATLHDCDDGSDQNPVRLGSTALGSFLAT